MKKRLLAALLLGMTCLVACNADSSHTEPATESQMPQTQEQSTDSETEPVVPQVYYVRTPEQPIEKELQRKVLEYSDYEEACKVALQDKYASTGYAVYDTDGKDGNTGNFLFGKYSEFVTKVLYNAKHVADYIDMNDYSYGNASIHPAVTYARRNDPTYRGSTSEKLVSCDRLVCWILYDSGLINQPVQHGLCVNTNDNPDSNLTAWCEKMGFEKIENESDLQAGDIIFVRSYPNAPQYPAHTFLHAGEVSGSNSKRGTTYYRYDAGSVDRIRCEGSFASYSRTGQPFKESLGSTGVFRYAYRPVENELSTQAHSSARSSGR